MKIERTIQETTTGTTGTILVKCSLGCIYDALVTRKSCISIRTEHQYLMASHFNFCSLFALYGTEIGVNVSRHVFLRLTIMFVSFL